MVEKNVLVFEVRVPVFVLTSSIPGQDRRKQTILLSERS
jgi:hypothetical protein